MADEIEKLIVKVEADTSSYDKNIDKAIYKAEQLEKATSQKINIGFKSDKLNQAVSALKSQLAGISNTISESMMKPETFTKSGGNSLKKYLISQLKDASAALNKELIKSGDKLLGLTKKYGADNTITVDYAEQQDKLQAYQDSLKKILQEFEGAASEPFNMTASLQELQDNLSILSGIDVGDFGLEKLLSILDEAGDRFEELGNSLNYAEGKQETADIKIEISRLTAYVNNLIKAFARLNNIDLNDLKSQLNNMGYGAVINGGITPKADKSSKGKSEFGTIAKAILGIRSLYMLVRKIVSQNEKITNAVSNIITAISNLLQPILNSIAKIFEFYASLIQSVAHIFKIESNTSKTARNTAKFDELNILTNNNTGDNRPKSTKEAWGDMSGLEKILSIAGLVAIIAAIIKGVINLIKLTKSILPVVKSIGEWISGCIKFIGKIAATIIEAIIKGVGKLVEPIKNILPFIKSIGTWLSGHIALIAGIAIAIAGVITFVKSLIDYIKDPSWDNLGNTLIGISVTLGGIALAIGSLPLAAAAAIALIIALITKFWDKINSFFANVSNKLHELSNNTDIYVMTLFGTVAELWDAIWNLLSGITKGIKQVFDGIIMMFKGDFKNGIISIGKGILNALIGVINTAINGINAIVSPIRAIIVSVGNITGKNWTMDNIRIPNIPLLARGGVIDQPTVAMVGEKGREIVTPEKLLTNIINSGNSSLASVYAQVGRQIVDAINNNQMQVTIGDDVIAKSAARGNNSYYKMTGKNLIGGTI